MEFSIVSAAVLVVIALCIFISFIIEKHSFYVPTMCNVCGKETGKEGNKRFKLSDGYMCQSCANKYSTRANGTYQLGYRYFSHCSVEEVSLTLKYREGAGAEVYHHELVERIKQKNQMSDFYPSYYQSTISVSSKWSGSSSSHAGSSVRSSGSSSRPSGRSGSGHGRGFGGHGGGGGAGRN